MSGNPQFSTGEVEFRLTSSPTDVRTTDPETFGNAYFQAKGLFEQQQEIELRLRPPPPPPPQNRRPPIDRDDNDDGDDGDDDGDPLAMTFTVYIREWIVGQEPQMMFLVVVS